MRLPMVRSAAELAALVEELGFLPLFETSIPGFSVADITPKDMWFVEGVEGPWEWRETLAASGTVAYGKLFQNKAGFISLAWYPDFANFRRDGYDFDARYEDSKASLTAKRMVDLLTQNGPMLSGDIRRALKGERGVEGTLTLMQMQTYLTIMGFDRRYDKYGRPYGWGIGRYALSEQLFGESLVCSAYERAPAQSFQKLVARVIEIMPGTDAEAAARLIR